MSRAPTRVFLSLQPVGYRKPAGADPFTYQDARPSRWRASWWTRGTSTEMYRGKPVATQGEAVRLARQWLNGWNKRYRADDQFVDTTDHPERYGYSHEPAASTEKKSPEQLDAEIAEALAKGDR
jgi:hypothetical protein